MSTRELLALTAATIMASGRRFPEEAVKDAKEILDNVDRSLDEAERIEFARAEGRDLDPDGFDSPEAIRAVLGKTTRRDFV